jgi:hypothetical protein
MHLQIVARLSSEHDVLQFQLYMEKKEADTVSVPEVELAFPFGSNLLDVIDQALSSSKAGKQEPVIVAALPGGGLAHTQQPKATKQHCYLPELDASYTGR